MSKPKYPISDKDMLELLHKYPFLRHRNVWTGEQVFHGKSRNLEDNYYKYWDGSGWEDLWKNRFLPRLFAAYDKLSKKDKRYFGFEQIKEKFGSLRIYMSGCPKDLDTIAEWISEYTCAYCGKEPRTSEGHRVIWTTGGWITHLCEDCARKELLANGVPEDKLEEELNEMKDVRDDGFAYKRYGKEKTILVKFKETPDNKWLEIDEEIELDKDKEREEFIKNLKGE